MMVGFQKQCTVGWLIGFTLLTASCRTGEEERGNRSVGAAVGERGRASLFVDEVWLNAHMESIRQGTVRVVEVLGFEEDAGKEHLPGAVSLATDEIERAPLWNLVSDSELKAVLESKGLVWDVPTVFYGTDPFAVARVIWALSYAGLEDPRWFWPGLRGWKNGGGTVQRHLADVSPSRFGRVVPGRPEYRVSTDEVKERLETGQAAILSVRSKREYDGRVSGYSYIESKGHIRGARWGGSASSWLGRRLDRTLDKAESDLLAVAPDPSRPVVFYCGTGWRSSLAFLLARELGYQAVGNYDGSWLEWSRDPSNPVSSR